MSQAVDILYITFNIQSVFKITLFAREWFAFNLHVESSSMHVSYHLERRFVLGKLV